MVPVFTCEHNINLAKEQIFDFVANSSECKPEQKINMEQAILKIASLTGIPKYHIVNAWEMLRDPKRAAPGIA